MRLLKGASTGPRPRGRGMSIWLPLRYARRSRFNGAAPARARNGCDRLLPHARQLQLQRGRARAGAEWDLLPVRCCLNSLGFNGAAPARARNEEEFELLTKYMAVASTGPRPRGRGMTIRSEVISSSQTLLQRGRARAGAECSPKRNPRQTPRRLQRGRARAGAECGANSPLASHPGGASTGPRPRGRGMGVTCEHRYTFLAPLQRGRARAGAECGHEA